MDKLVKNAAYIRGLCDGLEISDSTKEGKVLLAIVELLEQMSSEIVDIKESYAELDNFVDAIDESVSDLEEVVFEEDGHSCGCKSHNEEEDYIELDCPNCENRVFLDKEMLEDEEDILCPNCNEVITFESSCGGCDCSCEDKEDKDENVIKF